MKYSPAVFSSYLARICLTFTYVIIPCLTISSIAITLASPAAWAEKSTEKKERWFEVEVILFNQLGDKSKLKEQFPEQAALPHYKKVVDILSPFLQPNIASLKQQLPNCTATIDELNQHSKTATQQALEQFSQQQLNNLFFIKTVEEIALTQDDLLEKVQEKLLESDSPQLEGDFTTNDAETSIPTLNTIIDVADVVTSDNLNNSNALISDDESLTIEPVDMGLTEQQVALVKAAELYFNQPYFNQQALTNYQQYPNIKNRQLCVIPNDFFKQLQTLNLLEKSFDIDAFEVDKMPKVVNAAGQHTGKSPYLISKDDLKLNDIVKRLRWSKNFQPLLHIGWRQTPVTRTKSVPMRLFAGENLAYSYQQTLEQYQQTLANQALSEQTLVIQETNQQENNGQQNQGSLLANSSLDVASGLTTTTPTEALAKKQYLAKLLTDIEQVTESDIESLISETKVSPSEIEKQQKSLFSSESLSAKNSTSEVPFLLPEKPSQQWFLDGFFKVHLDHYLYITADFSILNANKNNSNKSQSEDASQSIKTVAFRQNRRVISSEIHYFDHPYIGMIVQIRRYTPPKPEISIEAECFGLNNKV